MSNWISYNYDVEIKTEYDFFSGTSQITHRITMCLGTYCVDTDIPSFNIARKMNHYTTLSDVSSYLLILMDANSSPERRSMFCWLCLDKKMFLSGLASSLM